MKAKFSNPRTVNGKPQGRTARESGSTIHRLFGPACKAVTPQGRDAACAERRTPNAERRSMAGQTLVMALIILGVLLVLGVVFIAIVNKNIKHAGANQKRSIAYDLAEAGVRYAHMQMLYSLQGADWRPNPVIQPVFATDPDYDFIRPPNTSDPGDYGGPDRRGSYSRLFFDRGRALVRVRYAPSDPTVFSAVPVGAMIQAGKARDYTIIESVGKAGRLDPNDPSQARLLSGEREVVESTKVIAFVSCGLIEQALFVDNKYHVSAAAELGFPVNTGAMYDDTGNGEKSVFVPVQYGQPTSMYEPYDPSKGNPIGTQSVFFGGSIVVNQDLIIHGTFQDELNPTLGDGVFVAGSIRGADNAATLQLSIATPNGINNAWQPNFYSLTNNGTPALNSDSPNFSTFAGAVKDAYPNGDSQGYPRGMSYKDPPSMLRTDPDTGLNRYVQMTQLSGRLVGLGNSGRYGHGQGVYCNNSADIQVPVDEQGREDVGSAESLIYDWLNPGNGQALTGWKGSFYVPRGAILRLVNDGFVIIRDGRAPANQRTWKEPDGSAGKRPGAQMNSANPADLFDSPTIRYKLVFDPQTGITYVFNSLSVMPNGTIVDVNAINSGNISSYRTTGYPFNGVLYFAGNVRVRGQIPTDMQLTVVSGATIYIDGSITKGLVNNGTHQNMQVGRLIDTPSKSMLALLAKDYVAVNTTQFFGTSPLDNLSEVSDSTSAVEWNPLRVKKDDSIDFVDELLLDPNTPPANGGNPLNPSTFKPYAFQYVPAGSVNGFENTNLLLAHTMDDGPAPSTFINMNVNDRLGNAFPSLPSTGEWQYLFDLSANNGSSVYYPPGFIQPPYTVSNAVPLYGLGGQSWQRYRKFEGAAFPIVTNDFTWDPILQHLNGSNTSRSGLYHLLVEDINNYAIGVKDTPGGSAVNDYIVAHAAIVPQDIRIEATIFAEEGSFFVIPGPWFNPNPDDRRDNYINLGASTQERDQKRLEDYGSTPNMPFYGEPLDVRIQVLGAVTENLTPPIGQQAEWLRKWGWIPRYHGASGELIPQQHTSGIDVTQPNNMVVPNITIAYDPVLATGRNVGFVGSAGPAVDLNTLIRYQSVNINPNGPPNVYYYALPPIPRLPVSPTLAYFGEVNP